MHRYVERTHRLVQDDEARLCRKGPGDAYPLLLAAAQLVGIAFRVPGLELDQLEKLLGPALWIVLVDFIE